MMFLSLLHCFYRESQKLVPSRQEFVSKFTEKTANPQNKTAGCKNQFMPHGTVTSNENIQQNTWNVIFYFLRLFQGFL